MKKFLPLLLVGLGFFILLSSVVFLVFGQKPQLPSPALLPEMIAGLPLTQSTQAEKAIAEIRKMHGNDFPLSSGEIGMYGADHSIIIWIAGTSTHNAASQMLISMRDRIAGSPGSSPFTLLGEQSNGNRTVYDVEGMGQVHFFFQSEKSVVWLAVDPDSADAALAQILEFYP